MTVTNSVDESYFLSDRIIFLSPYVTFECVCACIYIYDRERKIMTHYWEKKDAKTWLNVTSR